MFMYMSSGHAETILVFLSDLGVRSIMLLGHSPGLRYCLRRAQPSLRRSEDELGFTLLGASKVPKMCYFSLVTFFLTRTLVGS